MDYLAENSYQLIYVGTDYTLHPSYECATRLGLAEQQIILYGHHCTKYEENPASHHGGICEDGPADRPTDRAYAYMCQFCYY